MDIGQMNGLPILVIIAVIIYFAMRKSNKPEETQKVTQPVREQKPETSEPRIPTTPQSQIAWVQTKTQLPELHKKVTIYTTDNETLHGWARVNNYDYIHSTDDRTINNVTHWLDVGSPDKPPTTEVTSPRIKDTVQPASQIANKPHMPR